MVACVDIMHAVSVAGGSFLERVLSMHGRFSPNGAPAFLIRVAGAVKSRLNGEELILHSNTIRPSNASGAGAPPLGRFEVRLSCRGTEKRCQYVLSVVSF
jgi:hypothetical protein